eukprot:Gb_20719 [translate_table: standard]
MIKADRNRLKHMRRSTKDVDVPVPSGEKQSTSLATFIIKINIGRPAQSFYTVIDTGSDVTSIRCKPYLTCDPQEKHVFKPSKSASYRVIGCHSKQCLQGPLTLYGNSKCILLQSYVDNSGFVAILSTDSLSVGSRTVLHFAFGCVEIEINKGLGWVGGNLSFVWQTAHLYDKTFSYSLPSFDLDEFSRSLVFRMEALNVKRVKFTPLLTNPENPSFYFVGLKGISVGGELLSIPPSTFALNKSNGGGTVINSGSTLANLVEPAYSTLRDAFRKNLSNLKIRLVESAGLDTCYNISSGSIETPPITFHFERRLHMKLTQENILYRHSNTVWCIDLAAISDPPAIIGNVQQQN